MLGELSQKYPAESTENANAEEKTVSREELVKNVNKAQDAYDIAEEEYNASKTLVEAIKLKWILMLLQEMVQLGTIDKTHGKKSTMRQEGIGRQRKVI